MQSRRQCHSADIQKLTDEQWEEYKKQKNGSSVVFSVADEIEKFKNLLDMGAITQDEFDTKKKELLSK